MRSPLATLVWARHRMSVHRIAALREESRLKIVFVGSGAVLLWVGAFLAARQGFRWLAIFGAETLGAGASMRLSDLVLARLLAVLALALLTMLTLSNVLVAFATFFRAREVAYLIQSPLPVRSLYLGRLYECAAMSSWATAYLGSPFLLAYGIERQAPFLFYLALVAFYVPFVTLPAAAGSTIAILLVRVLGRARQARWLGLGVLALAMVVVGMRGAFEPPDLTDATTLQALIGALRGTQSPFLPSAWLTDGVLAAATGNLADAGFFLFVLASNAGVAVWLATRAAERFLYPAWTGFQDGFERRATDSRSWRLLDRVESLLGWLPQPSRALIAKDVKLFWRDPAQWSQFLLFFGLLGIYVANLRDTAMRYDQEPWRSWIALLNIAACLLVLATLTTRFVFPLISLEGRRFWILGLAPIGRASVAWHKLALSVATTALFTVGLAVLSAWQLRLEPTVFVLTVLGVSAATFALSGLAVGLGSLYPSFDEDNPSRIVSGLGGTLCFLLSLLYVVFLMMALGAVLHASRLSMLAEIGRGPLVVLAATWMLVLSGAVAVVPMRIGIRHLARTEM